jgi:hypothetical protein
VRAGDGTADVLFANRDRAGIALGLRPGWNRHSAQQHRGGHEYWQPLADLHELLPAGAGRTGLFQRDLLDLRNTSIRPCRFYASLERSPSRAPGLRPETSMSPRPLNGTCGVDRGGLGEAQSRSAIGSAP